MCEKKNINSFQFTINCVPTYSDDYIKNTVLWPNRQYKASTAKMAEYRYS